MTDSSELIFVSHAGHDGQWAEWVAWHLQQAGYKVELGTPPSSKRFPKSIH